MTEEAQTQPGGGAVQPVQQQPEAPETLDDWRLAHPTPASDQEVLDLTPNREEDAKSGPDPWPSQTAHVEMTKPDGTTFLAPKAQVEGYEKLGYTAGAEQEVEDIGAYYAEKAAAPPAEPSA